MKKEYESGRSMVEMLGVLAVVGVLSVAGVAGFQRAMNKHRANELMEFLSRTTALTQAQDLLGNLTGSRIQANIDGLKGSHVATAVMCSSTSSGSGASNQRYAIHVTNIPKGVCQFLMQQVDENGHYAMKSANVYVGTDGCTHGTVSCESDAANAISFIFEPDDYVACTGEGCSSTQIQYCDDKLKVNGGVSAYCPLGCYTDANGAHCNFGCSGVTAYHTDGDIIICPGGCYTDASGAYCSETKCYCNADDKKVCDGGYEEFCPFGCIEDANGPHCADERFLCYNDWKGDWLWYGVPGWDGHYSIHCPFGCIEDANNAHCSVPQHYCDDMWKVNGGVSAYCPLGCYTDANGAYCNFGCSGGAAYTPDGYYTYCPNECYTDASGAYCR